MTDTEINERLATEVMGYVRGETRAMVDCWLEYALPDSIREIRDWNPLKKCEQAILCRDALLRTKEDLSFELSMYSVGRVDSRKVYVEFMDDDDRIAGNAQDDTDARATCKAIIAVLDAEKEASK